jgi:hypothetical protein
MFRRLLAVGLISVVAFFATQGDAADAQQLRFQAKGTAEARFTVPSPLAHGVSTPRLGRSSPGPRGTSPHATLPSRGPSAPSAVVAGVDQGTDSASPDATSRRPVERAPPQFH